MARTSEPAAASAETHWPAPAKVNRFLHVIGRRRDGYHALQTVFQFLDRCDTVHLRPRDDGVIQRTAPVPGVPEEDDLCVRAARALQSGSGTRLGADIRVDKELPIGGGLGGGSSDAATVLVALNHLWGCGLGASALARLGGGLGADVPVFVRGQAAWAEGVGEVLQPLELDRPWFVVLIPGCQVSTADVFQAPELTRNSAPITIADFRCGGGRNDFEPVVRARYPVVARAFEALAGHGRPQLTGTGACVYLACRGWVEAEAAWRDCRAAGWRGFVARGLNRSPLQERIDAVFASGV
ncbi:4-(cytidine 5'-diphospho)-2-C-methyl-D-erythritol kinase [Aquisalimonas sp.]|uniref:4-(cytidine 5'-diphospho)-2-C-methyl-D-erythritol kinase n=1 Tax=Aquisalimonas sp. TaxID=1872621 RepID=UPI0025C535D5|nr:4-(cytidine 5'-diphospho)-2-C-methyl-D-erythritol kinase [Aquisalimonas sp.]